MYLLLPRQLLLLWVCVSARAGLKLVTHWFCFCLLCHLCYCNVPATATCAGDQDKSSHLTCLSSLLINPPLISLLLFLLRLSVTTSSLSAKHLSTLNTLSLTHTVMTCVSLPQHVNGGSVRASGRNYCHFLSLYTHCLSEIHTKTYSTKSFIHTHTQPLYFLPFILLLIQVF